MAALGLTMGAINSRAQSYEIDRITDDAGNVYTIARFTPTQNKLIVLSAHKTYAQDDAGTTVTTHYKVAWSAAQDKVYELAETGSMSEYQPSASELEDQATYRANIKSGKWKAFHNGDE